VKSGLERYPNLPATFVDDAVPYHGAGEEMLADYKQALQPIEMRQNVFTE